MVGVASDPMTVVLHAVRIKGFAETGDIATFTGLGSDIVLDSLAAAGNELVSYRDGRISGWRLTGTGKAVAAERIAHELARADCRPVIETSDKQFVALNGPLKELCTEWQLKGMHRPCIRKLSYIHISVQGVCDDLGEAFARFVSYKPRFTAAMDRFRARRW